MVDLSDLISPLVARWKIILLCTLLGSAAAFAISMSQPKVYQSTAVVYPRKSGGVTSDLLKGLPISLGANSGSTEYLITLLRSETLLRRTLSELDLAKRRDFSPRKHLRYDDALDQLKRSVDIGESRSGGVQISAKAYSPRLAADIANSLLDGLDRVVVRTSKRKTDFIATKLDETSRDLRMAEDDLLRFMETHELAEVEEQTRALIERLAELDGRQLLLDTQLQETNSDLENAGDLDVLMDLQVRKKSLEASREYVVAEKARSQAQLEQLPSLSASYGRLKRKVAVLEKTFEILTEQYQLARITQQGEDGDYQVVDRARPKTKKIAPRNSVNGVLGGMLSLLITSALITAGHRSRTRIKGGAAARSTVKTTD